jgi:hypothetical protein
MDPAMLIECEWVYIDTMNIYYNTKTEQYTDICTYNDILKNKKYRCRSKSPAAYVDFGWIYNTENDIYHNAITNQTSVLPPYPWYKIKSRSRDVDVYWYYNKCTREHCLNKPVLSTLSEHDQYMHFNEIKTKKIC